MTPDWASARKGLHDPLPPALLLLLLGCLLGAMAGTAHAAAANANRKLLQGSEFNRPLTPVLLCALCCPPHHTLPHSPRALGCLEPCVPSRRPL